MSQLFLNVRVLPETCDDFAGGSESCAYESVFTVSVSGLIEIHEVHIDLIIRDFAVILCCEMAPSLLEVSESVNPHF